MLGANPRPDRPAHCITKRVTTTAKAVKSEFQSQAAGAVSDGLDAPCQAEGHDVAAHEPPSQTAAPPPRSVILLAFQRV